jgi:hypothetical protein
MRRRAGLIKDLNNIPVFTYNHGGERVIYRASAQFVDDYVRHELAAERIAVRWSDCVLCPSKTAKHVLEEQVGHLEQAVIVPEPFVFPEARPNVRIEGARFSFLGRVSFAKGVDHAIHFLNVLSSFEKVDEIKFIGSVQNMPFKTFSGEDYIRGRLNAQLQKVLIFTGPLSRANAQAQLSDGGFSLNFSRSETFSYAFLEQLSLGLVPFTKAGTAMAEFYPEDLRHLLIPNKFDLRELRQLYETTRANGLQIVQGITEHARQLTSPQKFVVTLERMVANLKARNGRASSFTQKYRPEDVTVLMPTYNPGTNIENSVLSVLSQTRRANEILIVDDGSNDPKSIEVLAHLKNVPSVRIIRSAANEGLCATRIKLLQHCNTSLSIFLDDDDELDERYIAATLDAMNKSPVAPDAVVTWRKNFGESSELFIRYNCDDYEHFLSNDLRMTGLIKTEALRRVGFDADMRNGEADDWDFWLKFKAANLIMICLPQALFRYNFKAGSMSWPWSEGQSARTAELVANEFAKAVISNKVPKGALFEIISMQHQLQLRLQQQSQMLSGQTTANAVGNSGRKSREIYVLSAKQKHPIRGSIVSVLYRGITGVAKRLA